MFEKLGYKYLLIDSEIISQLFEEGFDQELQTFSNFGRIFILEPPRLRKNLPFDFKYINLPSKIQRSSLDVISKIMKRGDNFEFNKLLKLAKNQIRSKVLYIKKVRESVLTDIPDLYDLNFETCRKKRDCDLRLATYGMENCPHRCIYCFANYNWTQPTTVLFDFDKKLKEDLNKKKFKKLTKEGYPIHVGSIMDFGSELSIFFNQIFKVLKVLKGKNIFIGTKSPLISRDNIIKAIKEHGKAEIVFTYTCLGKELETNLSYNSKNFPHKTIKKLIDNKIRVILLYKPIIPGLNDEEKKIRYVLRQAQNAGITEISTGFLKINFRFRDSIKKNSPHYYKYFRKILSEQVGTDFLPSYHYRIQLAKKLKRFCDELGLKISFCQPHIGGFKSELANSFCPCRKERWQ